MLDDLGPAHGDQSIQRGRLALPLREFLAQENSGAVLLLAATVVALVWANSPWSESYERMWETTLSLRLGDADLSMDLRHWVNDGLMALFFFVAGLEIRREFDRGELRERRRVATPVIAALGGMAVPALLYLALNAGEPTARGWGITMGTDTAFALGLLTLVGGQASPRVRIFLLTIVIVDDVAALSVIAIVYTEAVSITALAVALGWFALVIVFQRSGFRSPMAYGLVGVGVWLATLLSGVHATVAGVALGVLASARPPTPEAIQHASTRWRLFREQPTPEYARVASLSAARTVSWNERLQHLLHPWTSYVVVPVFALANAGLPINSDVLRHAASSPVTLGIVLGLVVGKPVGILTATWLMTRRRLGGWPLPIPWAELFGAAVLAGIGFTVSLLIADISFEGQDLEDAKLGILTASVLAAALAWFAFRGIAYLPRRWTLAGSESMASPLIDLAEPVDPEVDHVRGPEDAPVTLVEYGGFQCPYCGAAESVLGELAEAMGDDLRLVFRHYPLLDVHPQAELAAAAAEAAAAQGKYWEMHSLLFAHQESLEEAAIVDYARSLGLDVGRFVDDLASGRHAMRVERDVASGALSGVLGTPTFFINGRRHQGAYDRDSLAAAVRAEASLARGH
ncbi:MAG: Na+/H+ antiporter NhaA [Dehalococcoidia bacterium]|nr:Na+/H+ antiporter NhaA [Dehalococcoidia bacterium]